MSDQPPGLRPGPPGHCRGSEGRTAGAREPGDPAGPFRSSSAAPLAPGSAPPGRFPKPGARRTCLSRVPPRTPVRLCNTRRELFSPQNSSSPGSSAKLPPLRVSSLARPLLVPKPRTPSETPALTSRPPCAGRGLRPPGRPSAPAPPHPGGSRASGTRQVSPAESRRVPGGPRAAGKRHPGPARSGAAAAAAAATPAGAGEGRAGGGAELPWAPALWRSVRPGAGGATTARPGLP